MLSYGIPLQYYTDQLRTFRYISHQDSIHILQPLPTDGVNPQWKQVVQNMGSKVIYALYKQKEKLRDHIAGYRIELSGHARERKLRELKMHEKFLRMR